MSCYAKLMKEFAMDDYLSVSWNKCLLEIYTNEEYKIVSNLCVIEVSKRIKEPKRQDHVCR